MSDDLRKDELLQETLEILTKHIAKLPEKLRRNVEEQVQGLRELIVDNRVPRFMIVGRRGAGKSSLINALFGKGEMIAQTGSVVSTTGKGEWYSVAVEKGNIDLLDTRGFGDESKPDTAMKDSPIEEIRSSIREKCPDAILFLCKAKEVDAHINHDIEFLREIRGVIEETHGFSAPVVALLSQVDELDPKRVEPPFENEIKQKNIHLAISALKNVLLKNSLIVIDTIPFSAYMEYEDGKIIYDGRWNIKKLAELLLEKLPKEAQFQFVRMVRMVNLQKKVARTVGKTFAGLCASIAATPIPIADILPITAAQISMIMCIAYIAGMKLTKDSAIEFASAAGVNIGTGYVLRELTRALLKFIPVAGNAVSAVIAFAGTIAISEAAIAYFIDGKDISEAIEISKEAARYAEREYKEQQGKLPACATKG